MDVEEKVSIWRPGEIYLIDEEETQDISKQLSSTQQSEVMSEKSTMESQSITQQPSSLVLSTQITQS